MKGNFIIAGCQDCSLYTFEIWDSPGDGDPSDLRVRVQAERAAKPMVPGTLTLKKALQGQQSQSASVAGSTLFNLCHQ